LDIQELQELIEGIDNLIAKMFMERMRVSADMVKNQAQGGELAYEPERDRERLAAVLDVTDIDLRKYMGDLYKMIFELCRSYQEKVASDSGILLKPPDWDKKAVADAGASRAEASMKAAARKMINIALIGMPGCGKTSIGRYLAKLNSVEFFDTDEIITEKAGKSIKRIIKEDGESVFRDMETAVLREAAEKRGCVIATGEGVIKRVENKSILQENCTVVFIDRAPNELISGGGSLSDLLDIKAVFLERLPLFLDWCDYDVTARGSVERTAQAVKDLLQRR